MFKVKDLTLSYGARKVISSQSFEIKKGRITAIIGRNGSGKSTLLSALAGVMGYGGEIAFCGEELSAMARTERAKKLSFLPQIMPSPELSVRELVSLGRSPYLGALGRMTDVDRTAVERAMSLVGISELACKRADRISGGELRLAYLAMILAQDTETVLLDEPSAFMDIANGRDTYRLLSDLRDSRGKTVVTVLHDLSAVPTLADDVAVLDGGRVVFCGSVADCLDGEVIEKTFGVTKHTDGASTWFC